MVRLLVYAAKQACGCWVAQAALSINNNNNRRIKNLALKRLGAHAPEPLFAAQTIS
jgi:hypothetical protein